MPEIHPFGNFVPANAKYLLLGSFPGKPEKGNNWFYMTKRNQFWLILERVYNLKLKDKKAKERLFSELKLAISDIVYQCERKKGTNADNNLIDIVYNTLAIEKILNQNKIEKIFFSSRFVEKEFRKIFKKLMKNYPKIELITLPSPSPRYAQISILEKVTRYKEVLPGV